MSKRDVYVPDVLRMLADAIERERPQGKWKAKSFHEFFCDNCGFSFDMLKCDFLENMKFCPNCGAKMKGADDDNA